MKALDPVSASYTPDITPLKLAAHKNNYEILKILIDRGAQLPHPHDIKVSLQITYRVFHIVSLKVIASVTFLYIE